MPALLINIKVDVYHKFELFKVTLADLQGLFGECHFKVRGALASECLIYATNLFSGVIRIHQDLQEDDWVSATLAILDHVESRSVFLYLEDHKLMASRRQLELMLGEFDEYRLDYLCYSFYQASQLDIKNLLPLNPKDRKSFREFVLNENNLKIVGKLSPKYCIYSLVSLSSVEYFRAILNLENKKFKIYLPLIVKLIVRIFPYPKYRKIIDKINQIFKSFNFILCASCPSSPFNVEKNWYEYLPKDRAWKYGVLHNELFANYDDDNCAYGESLIKRGAYPFDSKANPPKDMPGITFHVTLREGELYDCAYHSRVGRISLPPQIAVTVMRGSVSVAYHSAVFYFDTGLTGHFYANLNPVIQAKVDSEIEIVLYDEIFVE